MGCTGGKHQRALLALLTLLIVGLALHGTRDLAAEDPASFVGSAPIGSAGLLAPSGVSAYAVLALPQPAGPAASPAAPSTPGPHPGMVCLAVLFVLTLMSLTRAGCTGTAVIDLWRRRRLRLLSTARPVALRFRLAALSVCRT